jgi:FtsH-binding integral membrane protein
MPSVIFGLLALALGLWGLTAWWWSVTEFLRGALPIVLIGFGLVALAAGVQTVREPKGRKDKAFDIEGND